jgi:hypothetical protein
MQKKGGGCKMPSNEMFLARGFRWGAGVKYLILTNHLSFSLLCSTTYSRLSSKIPSFKFYPDFE